jgi:hypothetical protein
MSPHAFLERNHLWLVCQASNHLVKNRFVRLTVLDPMRVIPGKLTRPAIPNHLEPDTLETKGNRDISVMARTTIRRAIRPTVSLVISNLNSWHLASPSLKQPTSPKVRNRLVPEATTAKVLLAHDIEPTALGTATFYSPKSQKRNNQNHRTCTKCNQ